MKRIRYRPGEMKDQARFFLPLAMTSFVIIITHSLFNAGLARLPDPEVLIAAFAVAKSLMHIFQSPVTMIRQTVTALIDHRKNFRKTTIFIFSVAGTVVAIMGIVAFTGLSRWFFREIMGLSGQTLHEAILMLQILVFFPGLVAIRDYFAGFSIKFRTTPMITLASAVRISYVLIFISNLDKMSAVPSAYLAGLMFVGAVLLETITMVVGSWFLTRRILSGLDKYDQQNNTRPEPRLLTYRNIISFFSPLIATTLIQTTIMPIINSALARTNTPEVSISVFAVAWGLGMVALSPIMAFHQVPLNFINDDRPGSNKTVRLFAWILSGFTVLVMFVLSFTDLGFYILRNWIGASQEISILSLDVLKLMTVLPILMIAREYYWGILFKRRTTAPIRMGKAISLVTLVIVITIMTWIDPPNPAINGAVGMIVCELAECIYLYLSIKRSAR
ncbi:MAG: hypothetical protein SCM11_11160 [Bacillota bacterium]|nr:hypothetical protein [Bacillota bacterium]